MASTTTFAARYRSLRGLVGWLALTAACSSEGSPASSAPENVEPGPAGPAPAATPPPGVGGPSAMPSASGGESNPAAQAPLDNGGAGAVDSEWCRALGVFRENCQSCHASELRFGAPMPLTSFDELQAASVSDDSQSVAQRVQARTHDTARPMPPSGTLPAEDLAVLDAWFAAGAGAGPDATCAGLAPASAPTDTTEMEWPADCEELYTLTTSNRSNPSEKYVIAAGSEEHPQFIFDAPWGDDEVQVLAYRPITDNARVLHHWILYENDAGAFGGGLGGKFLVGWAPGSQGGTGLPDDVGLYMPNGAGSLRLDVHYYNLGNAQAESDASGVELCVTRTPRPLTATVIGLTGDATARVGRSDNSTSCTAAVTGTDAVTFASVSPHMHKLGVHAKLELTRAGQTTSLHDGPFDFNDQKIYPLDSVSIRSGDVLTTTCSYENDTGRTVRFGQNSDDEMCFNFVTYYPMGALRCGLSL